MLKAKVVQALALPLIGGETAVLVQEGADWNGMRKYRCIAPPQHAMQTIIAAREDDRSHIANAFREVFDPESDEHWLIVKASPELIAMCSIAVSG